MTEDFNKWWDSDWLIDDNPYTQGTPAYWAWEGWQAGAAAEREACAKLVYEVTSYEGIAEVIRARGHKL